LNHNSIIAVTGIGMITPLGISTKENWENMELGRSGIQKITKFDVSDCAVQIGGQLPESYYSLEKTVFHKRLFKQTNRATRLAGISARQAIEDSQLDLTHILSDECAAIIGSSGSSVRGPDERMDGTDSYKIIREMFNASAARVSLDSGFRGPCYTASAGSESGICAITQAYELIKRQHAKIVVAGGTDTLLTKNYIRRLEAYHFLSHDNQSPENAIKPFDTHRNGMAVSDGGCAVILESLEHAEKRNARIYALMMGYGSGFYGGQVERYKSASAAMRQALNRVSIKPDHIDYINANGLATIHDDRNEALAIHDLFRDKTKKPFVNSQKSMTGHCFSASGVVEFAITALSLYHRKLLPHINCTSQDPDCPIRLVPNHSISEHNINAAMCNTFGLSGQNYSVILYKA